jgi:hypothetical protein
MRSTKRRNSKQAAGSKEKPTAKDRVRKHRDSLRAQGLRPIQIWIPDTRRPGFGEEVRRQCLAVKRDPKEKELLDWVEQSMDYAGWV